MPQPKYRTSASKRDMRRSHHFLVAPGMSICKACGEVKHPHSACISCGNHKGKVVFTPKNASASSASEFSTGR